MAEENKIQLKIDPSDEQGVYANAVSIHVNPAELVIDFGYLLPSSQPATIKVVSRVSLSKKTAEPLMDILGKAIEKAKEGKK